MANEATLPKTNKAAYFRLAAFRRAITPNCENSENYTWYVAALTYLVLGWLIQL